MIQMHKQQIPVCSMIMTPASVSDRKITGNILDISDCPGMGSVKGRAHTLKEGETCMSQYEPIHQVITSSSCKNVK